MTSSRSHWSRKIPDGFLSQTQEDGDPVNSNDRRCAGGSPRQRPEYDGRHLLLRPAACDRRDYHIDIDNGVVESAGTSFFNKAVFEGA